MPLVGPEQVAPSTPTTWSILTTLLAASTADFGSHCPSAAISTISRPSSSPPCAFTCSAARFRPATIGATRSAIGPVMAAIEPMATLSCADTGPASSAEMATAESSFFIMALPCFGPSMGRSCRSLQARGREILPTNGRGISGFASIVTPRRRRHRAALGQDALRPQLEDDLQDQPDQENPEISGSYLQVLDRPAKDHGLVRQIAAGDQRRQHDSPD